MTLFRPMVPGDRGQVEDIFAAGIAGGEARSRPTMRGA